MATVPWMATSAHYFKSGPLNTSFEADRFFLYKPSPPPPPGNHILAIAKKIVPLLEISHHIILL